MYATKADMIQRFGEPELLNLTDAGRTGIIDDAILDMSLNDATSEIDSYLAVVLTTTPTSGFAVLIGVCCDIARYRLYAGIGGETEQVKERYDAAIRWLRDVSTGKARIGISTEPITGGYAACKRDMFFTKETILIQP